VGDVVGVARPNTGAVALGVEVDRLTVELAPDPRRDRVELHDADEVRRGLLLHDEQEHRVFAELERDSRVAYQACCWW
jgi:hypothetical protein